MILHNYLIKGKALAFDDSNLFLYYAKNALKGECEVFVAVDDCEQYGGAVFGEIGADGVGMIKYISVKKEMRNQGVAQKLLLYAAENFFAQGCHSVALEFVVEKNAALRRIVEKSGFYVKKESISVINTSTPHTRSIFHKYMAEEGDRLDSFMKKRRFVIKNFCEADAENLRQIKDEIGKAYPSYLDPFSERRKRIDEGSFLVIKNEKTVGYLALTELPNNPQVAEVSCRACLDSYKNTGVGVWTLLKTLEYVAASPGKIKKVIFNIDADDKKLTNMLGKLPVSFPGSKEIKLTTFYKDRTAK